jgi:Ca2+/Na+ antiporter
MLAGIEGGACASRLALPTGRLCLARGARLRHIVTPRHLAIMAAVMLVMMAAVMMMRSWCGSGSADHPPRRLS